MRPVSAALFLSVLSLPLFAAITGTVITSEGVPVAGARVSINALETPSARRTRLVSKTPDAVPLASVQTDERGSFSLASPKEPVIDLRVEMRGYEPFVRREKRDADAVAIALRKIDMVKGSVTAGGKPVANALVVLGTDYATRSNEEGHYEAPAIKPPYLLAVIHPDYAIDEELMRTGSVPERELIRTLSAGVTLTGRAVAADGASPVAGAEIRVDDWPLAVSGQEGEFTIPHAPTRWTAITAREGMRTGRHTVGGAKAIIVRLEPSAVLSGRVRDATTNAPIAGAMVEVSQTSVPGMVWAAGVTDASGTYSILVPHDSFRFSIKHPAYDTRGDSIPIAPGQQKTQDVVLTQLARVTGVVIDEATNRPVAAASVSPRNARDQGMVDMPPYWYGATPVTSGPDGKFDVRVVPGQDFYLHFAKTGLPQGRSEDMKLDAGGLKSAVVLTIPAGVAVTGRALDVSGKPLSGVSVVAGPGVAPGGVETLSTLLGPVVRVPVLSAGDGTFAMRLKEGTYNFWFSRDGYLSKQVRGKSITATGENAIETRLDPAVEVSGRVTRGGVGVADVDVGSEASYVSVTTASDGSFVLGGLSPGVTRLVLRKRKELIDEKRSITAPARGVTIDLWPGGTIRGHVVEMGTKTPIRSFRARVGVFGDSRSFSSEDGSFIFEHVPAGLVPLVVEAFGYVGMGRDVHVLDGKTVTDLVVELDTGVRLTGTVTDANGAPLSGVSIIVNPSRSEGGMIGGVIGGMGSPKPPPYRATNKDETTVTDANGRYALSGLVPGEESVHFLHPGHVVATRKITLEGRETKLDVQLSAVPR
jgi:protocatechuate 3,4-dioxygenase beta subunit